MAAVIKEAADFLLEVSTWSKWFSSLDMWAGQSMQYERVAWLKFHGVPLHLAENKVFDDAAGLFGKVIHNSQLSSSDKDLSVNYVGILVDHGKRIEDVVTLKWKNKRFKVWITEDRDEWVPDCLSEESSPEFSVEEEETRGPQVPENDNWDDFIGEFDKPQHLPVGGRGSEENINDIGGEKSNGHVSPQDCAGSFNVFSLVSGEKNNTRKKPFDISRDKHKPVNNGLSQEVSIRPKRTRVDLEDSFERFGNLGRPNVEKSVEDSVMVLKSGSRFDLNKSDCPVRDGDGVISVSSSEPRSNFSGNEENSEDKEVSGEDILKEIDATVFLGRKIGVDLRNHCDLVEEAISNAGNNGVSS
ncbi:hypothetical protein HanIR_Chr15g0772731 [Helianthus annuus]|nr:hypothetical protein HanIR_Chr15g0772731 [Helianthus annuus]